MAPEKTNLNASRSQATRERLIEAAIGSLIEHGYHLTTGVEVCRRAGMTRGALNHHFPDLSDLLVEVLLVIYGRLNDLVSADSKAGPMESLVRRGFDQISQPEFKAVIELWLASRNDASFGRRVADAIQHGSVLISPEAVIARHHIVDEASFSSTYWTIIEALIGLGLGRTVSGGSPVRHEQEVVANLLSLAKDADRTNQRQTRAHEESS